MPVANRKGSVPLVPYWASDCGRAVVYLGDCRDVMAQMEPEQFHAVVTDPPYDLTDCHTGGKAIPGKFGQRTEEQKLERRLESKRGGFMGKKWDGTGVAFESKTWEAVLRLAKPGAHLLSFGGTRTSHRMVCAVEDAGWEIRDTLMWVYGSGFPKGRDVSKDIDKMLGADRGKVSSATDRRGDGTVYGIGHSGELTSGEPVTDAARQWSGWNTQLKPSYEPIVMARKPMVGMSVAQCVMEHGTGAINVDGCRVGDTGGTASVGEPNHLNKVYGNGMGGLGIVDAQKGRHPANLVHDGSDEVVELFPAQAGGGKGGVVEYSQPNIRGDNFNRADGRQVSLGMSYADSGSAARFFYTAKAGGDRDRPHGKGKDTTAHPTCKPLDLMQYLVRLVCVRGGIVLDPFMGSGSTGCAALAEGVRFVGIEQSVEYADIAVGRLRLALQTAPQMAEMESRGIAGRGVAAGGRPVCSPERRPPPQRLE